MLRVFVWFCLFVGVIYAQALNYGSLDPSYYKYIKLYHSASDEEVSKLVENLNNARKKTGLFLGLSAGGFNNDISSVAQKDYLFGYGAKFGYQSFLPSFFESIFYPNYVGKRIYIQFIGSSAKEEALGKLSFLSISVNGDLLIDLPAWKGIGMGVIAGAGIGNMARNHDADSELMIMLNTGLGLSLFGHNRLELELKIISDRGISLMGSLFSIGYQYVF